MEKILVKKLVRGLICLALASVFLFVGFLWAWGQHQVYHEMGQVLEQEEKFYRDTQKMLQNKMNHYTRDYMGKIHGVEHMLAEHGEMWSQKNMKSLCEFFGVEQLYIFGNDGRIHFSSDETSIGRKLLPVEDAKPFQQMIKNGGDYIFNFSCKQIIAESKGMNFMAMPMEEDGYAMLLMGIDEKNADELKSNDAMQNLLLRIPTTHDNAMFALDKNTGEILGAAAENNPLLSVKNICREKSFLEVISGTKDHEIIRVKGRSVFLKTRTVDNVIFVDLRLASALHKQMISMFLGVVLLFIIIIHVGVVVIRRYFRKYVFDEINAIEQTIQRLIDGDDHGDENVAFENSTSEELQSIVEALNDWNVNIRSSQKKLNWVINATNPNAAMFECMCYRNKVYYSDNLQSVLGLSNAKWEVIKNSAGSFKAYFNQLDTLKNEAHIVKVGEKYLKLKLYQMERDYFGIIIDKTDAVNRRNQQKIDLQQAVEDSETDSLTGLLNRRGFETNVRFRPEGSFSGAVMLMMDVDNFKTVNDTMGHPEGDILLQKVGECLKRQFRNDDICARFGGDEFAVFLSAGMTEEILPEKLKQVQEKLRKAFSEYSDCGVSISIGAAYVRGTITGYEQLYQCADEALYRAKHAGKDRYEIAVR